MWKSFIVQLHRDVARLLNNMVIDTSRLPRITKDTLELKEMMDPTFSRALEEDMTDELFEMLESRKQADSAHSFIASFEGTQGCLLGNSRIRTEYGWKRIDSIKIGEYVLSVNKYFRCEWKKVINIHCYENRKKLIKFMLRHPVEPNKIIIECTPEHRLFIVPSDNLSDGVYMQAKDIKFNWYHVKFYFPEYNKFAVIKSARIGGRPDRVYDLTIEGNSNYIVEGVLSHNSGKSYASITMAAILDPNISVENIYFDYNRLVYDKNKLRPHMSVLVDEQTEAWGIDSQRVGMVLQALKEQLRKKSIHFFFVSPTLKPEYSTSMMVFETMFIDKEEQVCYAAMKTRDLHCLGYVRIPHPREFVSEQFLAAYERKKDAHLDVLTGKLQVDDIQEMANKIVANRIFIIANRFYVEKRGYIPSGTLRQIVEKIFPEYRGNVFIYEVCDRIKFDMEMCGRWEISGGKKKDDVKSNVR
jgi:hypothetical protein